MLSLKIFQAQRTARTTLYSDKYGGVDRVDYLGGVTFCTNENSGERKGVSISNYSNIWIDDEIEGNFTDKVITDPLFMHEFGHSFDSQKYGVLYLFNIGIPSLNSAKHKERVNGEPSGVTTHKFKWYEMNANKYAKEYFSKYYGVDWNTIYRLGTYETYYPTIKR
jgi:hypothetical protein